MIVQQGIDLGTPLHETVVKRGLVELNPDIHFDLAACIGQIHPMINQRQGVYVYGQHICSMDRSTPELPMIPEYKVWTETRHRVVAQWADANKPGASMRLRIIHPGEYEYRDKREIARKGIDPSLSLRDDGAVVEYTPYIEVRGRGRVFRLGWRHTFEALLRRQVRGVTRTSLAARFGVDMLKYPVGPPDEVAAALLEE